MGYGANAIKSCCDNKITIFQYGTYNWNIPEFKELKINGIITIENSCFDIKANGVFFQIQRGKKLKTEMNSDMLGNLIVEKERIRIDNCTQCWNVRDTIDVIALRLVYKIFDEYLKSGLLQEEICITF